MANNPIRLGDHIVDDTLETIIDKLRETNSQLERMSELNKKSASALSSELKKASIATSAQREEIDKATTSTDKLAKAEADLKKSKTEVTKQILKLKAEQSEQNRINKLTIKLNNSAEGSYDKLSAQYSLNKIELNKMSEAQRKNTKAGQDLEQSSKAIFEQMKSLQEATGKTSLNVGNYSDALEGLVPGFSGAIQGAKGLLTQFWALVANPVGAIIAAVVLSLVGLYKAFEQTVGGAGFLEKAMTTLGEVFSTVLGRLGDFITGEISFKELLFETTDAVEKNVKASWGLVDARRALAQATADSEKVEADLGKEIIKLQAIRDNDTVSLSNKRKAAIALSKVEADAQKEAVKRAKLNQDIAQADFDIAKNRGKSSEAARLLQIELTKAITETTLAENELLRVQEDANKELQLIRLDIFEQELDLLLDVTDRRKTVNEQQIADERTTLEEKRNLANQNVTIIEEAFQKQIKAFEELNDVQIDQNLLLSLSGAEILKYSDALGFSERAVNRLREVVIEKIQADQDNLSTLRAIEKEEKKQQQARIERAEKAQKNRVSEGKEFIEQNKLLALSEIDLLQTTEAEKTKLRLEAEKDRLEALIRLNEVFGGELSDLQIAQMQNVVAALENEIKDIQDGDFPDIYEVLGLKLTDEQKESTNLSIQYMKDSLTSILNDRLEVIDAAVESSKSELDVAQTYLDEQLSLAREGRDADVEGARENLEDKREINQRAIEQQRKAQRQQQIIQDAQTISAIVTASANIIEGWSSVPFVGSVLGIAAVGTMIAAFATSKAKARKTASFGGGGDFDIDGGSHASGNDVSLGVHNGTEMRVEGGEKAAIFSKSSIKKYGGSRISEIVKSINKGYFQDKYGSAFSDGKEITETLNTNHSFDVSPLIEENKKLRTELKRVVKDIPQPIQNWDDKGYSRHLRRGNTTELNIQKENSFG